MFGMVSYCGINRMKVSIRSQQVCMHEPEVAPAVVNQCENIITNSSS